MYIILFLINPHSKKSKNKSDIFWTPVTVKQSFLSSNTHSDIADIHAHQLEGAHVNCYMNICGCYLPLFCKNTRVMFYTCIYVLTYMPEKLGFPHWSGSKTLSWETVQHHMVKLAPCLLCSKWEQLTFHLASVLFCSIKKL